MYNDSVRLIEMPDLASISVCMYSDHEDVAALGERINARFEEAYMNGYNWDALIRSYVGKADRELMNEVESDPESGMFSANMTYSPENLEKMKRFESHLRTMLADEKTLMEFIEANCDEIEWD